MASNDEVLKRLWELGAKHTDAAAKREQRELVKNLASNLDVQLDEEEEQEPVSETVPEPESAQEAVAEPVHEEPVHEEPVHEEPVHEEPVHEEPVHEEPVTPEPVHVPTPAPVKEKPTPVKEAPKPVSAARATFEQPQENKAKKIVAAQRKSMPPPRTTAPAPTGGNECDLSDPKITEAYEDVRDDNTDSDWLLLGYGSSKKELKLYGSGNGGLKEFVAALPDAEVVYGYIRMKYGDSGRAKFVFITYVPETLSGLAKAKANMHKPSVDRFLKYMHIQVAATTPADLAENTIQAKLQAAAGANYGTGGQAPAGSENFGSIKNNSKSFFLQTEKRGSVQIKYNKDPLSRETPVSLTGRAGITEKYIST